MRKFKITYSIRKGDTVIFFSKGKDDIELSYKEMEAFFEVEDHFQSSSKKDLLTQKAISYEYKEYLDQLEKKGLVRTDDRTDIVYPTSLGYKYEKTMFEVFEHMQIKKKSNRNSRVMREAAILLLEQVPPDALVWKRDVGKIAHASTLMKKIKEKNVDALAYVKELFDTARDLLWEENREQEYGKTCPLCKGIALYNNKTCTNCKGMGVIIPKLED